MKVVLVISSLRAGGAEWVLSSLANYWVSQGHEVTLITLDLPTSDFYVMHSRIRRVALNGLCASKGILNAIYQNIKRVVQLRRAIADSQASVVISFVDIMNILTLVATMWMSVRVIVSERTHPARHRIGRAWSRLRKLTYGMADLVVLQTESVNQWVQSNITKCSALVIPNPVLPITVAKEAPASFEAITGFSCSTPIIMAMGRLGDEKGFDLLLKSFAIIQTHFPDWRLVILGEGAKRQSLQELINELDLVGKVSMPGAFPHPERLLQHADLFVLSSRYEGFPNALLLAMACGLPVISFNCASGPSEIIRHGVDGLLVPSIDENALATTIMCSISDEAGRKSLALKAPEVLERFSMPSVAKMWEQACCGHPCSESARQLRS